MSREITFFVILFCFFLASCGSSSSSSKKRLSPGTSGQPSGGGGGGGGAVIKDLDVSWTPQWSALVGYWPLNGTLGSISDQTQIPATIGVAPGTAIVSGGMSYIVGQVNQGVSFSGSDDILVYPSGHHVWTHSFTATAWFKTSSNNSTMNILSQNAVLALIQISNQKLNVCLNNCNAGSTSIADGNWHFVATVGNGTSINVYLDGNSTPEASQTVASTDLGLDFVIGSLVTSEYFTGSIDDVAIYNTPLTTTELATIYNHQK